MNGRGHAARCWLGTWPHRDRLATRLARRRCSSHLLFDPVLLPRFSLHHSTAPPSPKPYQVESSWIREACEKEAQTGSAWLGRASLLRLFRLGKCPDLSHQAQLILYVPRLGDLASLYAVEGDAREFHLIAGRSNAHIVPLMGGSAPPASHHLVSLSYEVLNGAYHVREALPEICCLLLSSLGLPGCIEFLCCVEIPGMVPEFFLLPTYHGFVLFRRHLRLLLPEVRFPLADHNTWCMVPLEDIRCTLALSPTERSARKRRQEWNSYRLLVGGSQLDTRWERQPACGAIGTFNEGHHRSAQGPVHPLRYFAP